VSSGLKPNNLSNVNNPDNLNNPNNPNNHGLSIANNPTTLIILEPQSFGLIKCVSRAFSNVLKLEYWILWDS
jgi:hypothetical protein